MSAKTKKISEKVEVKSMVENIIGCKWSLTVIDLIKQGINRPGAMQKSVDGLTTKVLNERLRKLVKFGIARKTIYPEIPPHVDYKLTPFGTKFIGILDAIDELENDLSGN